MSLAIRCRQLSKCYQISRAHDRPAYRTLREDVLALPKRLVGRLTRTGNSPLQRFRALHDVSFDVAAGEILGIIGRNGAGKSTLLKILARITDPSEGRVELYGRVGSLLEVGTGFHNELTGRENIFLNGAILGMRKTEINQKLDAIVAFAEVDQFLDTPVKRYSSGMYMRLAFAVAAHLEPEILVVDEVLAVGDAQFQEKCLGKMREVGKSGRTVLFVSHNMNAVEQLCSRALLLEKGVIRSLSADVGAVIKEHLFGERAALQTSEWVNSGEEFENPWFTPVQFSLTDRQGGKLIMPVPNNAEIWVQIEAEIAQLDAALTVGYALYAENGHLLYWSYQTDQAPERWPRLRPGRCVLRSRLPSRFLNEGSFRIELIGGLHFRQWLFEPGVAAPSIFLTIQGGLSDSPVWMVKRPGLLAPVLEWVTPDGTS